jgi:hypothetical protein
MGPDRLALIAPGQRCHYPLPDRGDRQVIGPEGDQTLGERPVARSPRREKGAFLGRGDLRQPPPRLLLLGLIPRIRDPEGDECTPDFVLRRYGRGDSRWRTVQLSPKPFPRIAHPTGLSETRAEAEPIQRAEPSVHSSLSSGERDRISTITFYLTMESGSRSHLAENVEITTFW